jgi:hypothetical protein
MLSNNHSFRKLNLLHKKRSKVEPTSNTENVSLEDIAYLVKRLSVQIDDLETWKEESKKSVDIQSTEQRIQQLQPPPVPQTNQSLPIHSKTVNRPPSHTTIDPWASYVPQNYGALLQRLEDIESLQKCPNDCCTSTGTVTSADGVPWPRPIEPFQFSSSPLHLTGGKQQCINDMLEVQYTHWCTLMRCLPLMDPVTSAHVKTVGLYAMREILKAKASQNREYDHHNYHHNHPMPIQYTGTSTRLRNSMSRLSHPEIPVLAPLVPTVATQDMPAWMSTSETKVGLDDTAAPPPPVPPKETETTTTPTPSGFPSPLFSHTGKRFQKWVKYKKSKRKANTDTTTTPMEQSQPLRKIGSWFF